LALLALGRRDAEKHHRNDEDELHRTLLALHAVKLRRRPCRQDNARAAKNENEI
jgi:hypothetical protein